MIAASSIQEVRDRADIVEVVGNFLSLKKRGVNYLANCPFHDERTPSFNVNPTRGIYKCFGCGKAGDALSFIQEYEKFSFVEAVRWMAEFYNITLEESEQSDEQKNNKHIEESLRILFEYATKYFENQLWHTEEGQIIGLGYFKERGFTKQVIEKFRLGYSLDDWNAFHEEAMRSGYSSDLLLKSSIVSEKNGKLFDTYRGRVIFPIESNTGKVVGFGARILKTNDKAPKYLNSAENEVYNKSKILYGLYQSKSAIAKKNQCILVEGYTDVISLHQNGVENVVSSSGTSLTEGQLKLIKNLTRNLTIIYDGDAAGIKAAIRGLELALSNSFNINIVLLPDGDDPDSFVQKHGEERFYNYIELNKKDVIDFQIELKKDIILKDSVEKSALVNDLARTIAHIDKAEDFVLQQEYIRKVSQRLDTDEQGLIALVNKYINTNNRETYKQEQRKINEVANQNDNLEKNKVIENDTPVDIDVPTVYSNRDQLEHGIIKILLKYALHPLNKEENVIEHFFSSYDISNIYDPLHTRIITAMEDLYQRGINHDQFQKYFIQHEDTAIQSLCINLLMKEVHPNPKWESEAGIVLVNQEENYISEVSSTFAYFELSIIQKYIKENLEELKNKELSPQEILVLMNTHKDLKEHEKSLLNLVVKPYH